MCRTTVPRVTVDRDSAGQIWIGGRTLTIDAFVMVFRFISILFVVCRSRLVDFIF